MRSPGPRAAAAAMLFALVAGCGGEEPGDQLPRPTEPAGPAPSTTPPTAQGVQVRVVNLYVPQQPPEAVDLVPDVLFTDPADVTPFDTVALGESTDYFEPPADNGGWVSMSFFAEGDTDPEGKLFDVHEEMPAGAQRTILLLTSTMTSGNPAMGLQQLDDLAAGADPQSDWPAPKPGKAQVVGNATALNELIPSDENTFLYGSPGAGCLDRSDPVNFASNVGGTQSIPYDVNPGTVEVAAYAASDLECGGDPVIDPAQVEAAEGSRTYVLAWSRSDNLADAELLVLQVPESSGPGETATTTTPG